MILPFSTQLNGKPTYFIEKIWEGLLRHNFKDDTQYIACLDNYEKQFGKLWDFLPEENERMTNPKIHTIREDATDRWKPGTKIDFFINCRQKDMFRFAPVLPVVSVQSIQIDYYSNREILMNDLPPIRAVIIDDIKWLTDDEIFKLAQNDGFDAVEDFFAYFNEGFKGKIIHWTDLKY
ncbi:hypothetical protein [Flavobacterium sp. AED]|uniref:hypothetical protein n=1 Tax=Flavobacterium sp. AED TaxID=1423323 RepID=UPI00057C6931|nr:hypothetical protein [Flavobacterium sp. AED]KIA86597.1 hypothetical protein OA85_02815 [Flavobacterium sp. AED]